MNTTKYYSADAKGGGGTEPVPVWVAKHILAARDALTKDNYQEAWHQLYSIANPKFDSLVPWIELEEIAAGNGQPSQLAALQEENRKLREALLRDHDLMIVWVEQSHRPGWSTHLNDAFEKRSSDIIKLLHSSPKNEVCPVCKNNDTSPDHNCDVCNGIGYIENHPHK